MGLRQSEHVSPYTIAKMSVEYRRSAREMCLAP
jgi:hypothetical protein